jgi:hypothetical protein
MKNLTQKAALLLLAGLTMAIAGPGETYINQLTSDFVGGDSDARVALRQMTRDVMAPTIDETARATHETDLLTGLSNATDATIQQFLIRELELAGRSASIDPLGAVLGNDSLYEPAVQALIAIYQSTGDPQVHQVIRTAMATAADGRLMTFMRAAGSIQDRDQATHSILLNNALETTDWDMRSTALRSMANIGDPGSREILAGALTTTNMYQKSRIITWNLLYARRLAERGMQSDATAICNEITALAEGEDLKGVQSSCHAITAADIMRLEIQNIIVSVEKPGKEVAGNAPDLEILVDKVLRINITAQHPYEINITDIKGKSIWSKRGNPPGHFRLPKSLFSAGAYTISVKSGNNKTAKTITMH